MTKKVSGSLPKLFRDAARRFEAGQWRAAERLCRSVLARRPAHVDALHMLGLALSRQRRDDEAVQAMRRVIRLRPNDPILHSNLGEVYRIAARLEEAVASYRKAIRLAPRFPEAHFHLGNVLKMLERPDDAIKCYRRAIELRHGYPGAHYNLANTLREEGRAKAAVAEYHRALTARPDWSEAHLNLGNALSDLGRVEDAIDHYRTCAELDLDADVDASLGSAYVSIGKVSEAKDCYRRCLARHPQQWLFELRIDAMCERIAPSSAFIDDYRARLADALSRHAGRLPSTEVEDLHSSGAEPPMALAYHGRDVLPLMSSYARLFADSLPEPSACPPTGNPTPRVGIVVTNGHEGVFARCLGGIVERLGGQELQVSVVCSRAGRNVLRQMLRSAAIDYFVLPTRLDEAAEQIRAARFDLLHYWEVGTDSTNYFLPFFQPAPLQTATWGWPVTTGNPRIDSYVSSVLLEPDGAEHHYAEPLTLLESLPTYYYHPPVPTSLKGRDSFGLPARDHVYLCVQNLRKYHPDFDRILADILRADSAGQLFLLADAQSAITSRLLDRLQLTMADVYDRVHVLPRMEREEYLNLLSLADVVLDTLYYGGGANTVYDAVAVGAPLVTLPGEFHRGRWASATYRKLNVTDAIAETPADYVRLAVQLGTEADWRHDLRSRVLAAREALFEDQRPVRELERFFVNLIGSGG